MKKSIKVVRKKGKRIADRTIVIFRKWKDNGDIDALFPEMPGSEEFPGCTAYAHLGQHSNADYYGVMEQTIPAKPSEYKYLLAELESIGYDNLVIRQKYTRR